MSYKVIKDASGKVVAYGPSNEQYMPSIKDGYTQVLLTEEELAVALTPVPKTKTQLKIAELGALATQYSADMSRLQLSWLAASVSDGETEVSRKALIQEDLVAVKMQNALDRASIVAKYA